MPELPEVETIASTLMPLVQGRTICKVNLLHQPVWQGEIPATNLIGHTIKETKRRGKLLLLKFEPTVEKNRENSPTRGVFQLDRLAALGNYRRATENKGADKEIFGKPGEKEMLRGIFSFADNAPRPFWQNTPQSPNDIKTGHKNQDKEALIGLAFHLKMSGRLFVYPKGTKPGRHTRLIIDLDDKSRLFFDDMRTFGYARAMSAASLDAWPFWQKLGPEPLEITPDDFAARFMGRKRKIKALLLDQTVIAGIGNIYADESLFRAHIRPDALAHSLSKDSLKKLHEALLTVLQEAILACGSSIRDYRTARGDAGSFQNSFKVYGRINMPCKNCGKTLRHERIAGRGTSYCPVCQK